jgi:hypothetical protein
MIKISQIKQKTQVDYPEQSKYSVDCVKIKNAIVVMC